MLFADRAAAGRELADRLGHRQAENPLILALPRGGVPVAYEVARALDAPLDVIVVRKLGVPWQPEFAMGALGEGGRRVIDEDTVRGLGVSPAELAKVERRERAELERRAALYRARRPRLDLAGRSVIIVDDGIATGASARAACAVALASGARRVVLAAPVIPIGQLEELLAAADEVVWVHAPDHLGSVGQWYADFTQVADRDVVALLGGSR